MRIFIGLTEIAGIAETYAKGFRELGHETLTVILKQNQFYPDSKYDIVLSRQKSMKGGIPAKFFHLLKRQLNAAWVFPQILRQCDVFVYLWGTSFLPGYFDYYLIRRARKKIVSTFWGSDIRHADALRKEMEKLNVVKEIEPFLEYLDTSTYSSTYKDRKRIVSAAERYTDLILSQPGYAQLQTKPYMRANVPIDLALYRFNIPDREIPLMVHIPSKRGIKGTEFILASIDQLREEGLQFEFRLIENMPNTEVRKLLNEADILVDELFSETIGVLSTEAMASGTVTLVRYMLDYAMVPAGCPAVNVTMDTLSAQLRNMIADRPLRRRLAEAGRRYVEANNDHIKVCRDILDWLKPGGIKKYDFMTSFHQIYKP